MTSLAQRSQIVTLVDQAVVAGARQARACQTIYLSARKLQRWRLAPHQGDHRRARVQDPRNNLSELARQRVLAVANSKEFGHLAPSQIVPLLADQNGRTHGRQRVCAYL